MKRKITLIIALALAFTVGTVMRSDSVTKAQNTNRSVFDTGLITLGPNQKLRFVVSAGTDGGTLLVDEIVYQQQACTPNGACRHDVANQNTLGPLNLMPREAATFDMANSGSGVRIVARTNIKDPRGMILIINTITGNIDSLTASTVPGGIY